LGFDFFKGRNDAKGERRKDVKDDTSFLLAPEIATTSFLPTKIAFTSFLFFQKCYYVFFDVIVKNKIILRHF
jgi:hypothetical protein